VNAREDYDMEWNDDNIAQLRQFWAEGLSTAEIGRRMSVSKNAVVGKAHRLNLAPRPSPIRRDGISSAVRPASPRRVVGPTLPPLSAAAIAPPAHAVAPRTAAQAARPAPVRAVPYVHARLSNCCWPIGEPGTQSFRFCDADATHGKPYCSHHASLAYVRVRDRRDEVAA
jgi:GcrA cell cycle regulator